MLTLVQFDSSWNVPSPSPFCVKVETFLRMVGLEYRVEYQGDPRKAPKGKLPYIKDKGHKIPDSETIIEYLQTEYNAYVDVELSERQQAFGLAIKRLCEDHLYWALVNSRWCDEKSWPTVKKEFFKKLPVMVRPIVSELVKKNVMNALNGQGFGRHSHAEIYQKGKQDIDALAVMLGENSYMLGEVMTSYDATVYGVLANILYVPLDTPLQQTLKQHVNLVAYCERIKSTYYPEY
jgi:glutathione S-transferase